MEKIYMQEKESKNKKNSQWNFSVILSFAVAIFALFSIAVFGVVNNQGSGESYAAPTGDSFTGLLPEGDQTNVGGVMGMTSDEKEYFSVPLYYANSVSDDNRIFCVEIMNAFGDGKIYSKADVTNDSGLVYILNNSYANGVKKFDPTSAHGEYSKYLEIWGTQAAIWLYLAERYPNEAVHQFPTDRKYKPDPADSTGYPLDTKTALLNATKFRLVGGPTTMNKDQTNATIAKTVRKLVDEAKNIEGSGSGARITVKAANDQLTKTSDGKFYQTALISVTGTNNLISYDITKISGVDGAIAVDENGNKLNTTNIAAGKKFYLRIPVGKVTEKTQTLKVDVSGNFNTKTGVYYTSDGYQKVISLEDNPEKIAGGIDFTIVGSPDTGMNAAQTIYFIGLIVLLCGIGIVYANTKPVQSKQ